MSTYIAVTRPPHLPLSGHALEPRLLFLEHFREISDITVFLNSLECFLIKIIIIKQFLT